MISLTTPPVHTRAYSHREVRSPPPLFPCSGSLAGLPHASEEYKSPLHPLLPCSLNTSPVHHPTNHLSFCISLRSLSLPWITEAEAEEMVVCAAAPAAGRRGEAAVGERPPASCGRRRRRVAPLSPSGGLHRRPRRLRRRRRRRLRRRRRRHRTSW